jgi:hypothetical protein
MDIMQVTRVNPQPLFAVPVAIDTLGQIKALFLKLHEFGYTTTEQTAPEFSGGLRLIIKRANGAADQVVYLGDMILVADATYDPKTGWGVSRATQVSSYGMSTELAGTAQDFEETFTALTTKPESKR